MQIITAPSSLKHCGIENEMETLKLISAVEKRKQRDYEFHTLGRKM